MSPGDNSVLQGLVQWSGMSPSLATWENLDSIRRRFPTVAAWGQAASQGEGIVSSSPPLGREDKDIEAHHRPRRATRPSVRVYGPEWRV
jgi:hypothetical protein